MTDSQSHKAKITILGAGTWGATLSWLYGSHERSVNLWTRNKEKAETLKATRRLDGPLPVRLPAAVNVTSDLEAACAGSAVILFCCTSQSLRAVCELVAKIMDKRASSGAPALVSAVKGLELVSLKRMSEILSEGLPGLEVLCLSGPNLAAEILEGKPTASVVAATNLESARRIQEILNLPALRVYSNDDLTGVELGGTLKNIIAIAAGVSDGLALGTNAKAALITRGLAEITRLSTALGASPLTLSGLSGMGDLIATCVSPLSRNYRLGIALSAGQKAADAIASLGATAEGVPTTEAVCELSKRVGIAVPIAEQVNETLKGKTTPEKAIMTLMTRPLVSEKV